MQDIQDSEVTETVDEGTHGHTNFRGLTNSRIHAPGLTLPADEAMLNISTGVWHQGIEAVITEGTIRCVVNADGDLVVQSIDGANIEVTQS